MNDIEREEWIACMLQLVRDESRTLGPGIRTVKDSDDRDARDLHDWMLELERRGEVVRNIETEIYVAWKLAEKSKSDHPILHDYFDTFGIVKF